MTDPAPVISYLGLPAAFKPSPFEEPVEFLQKFIRQLPPHLLTSFSSVTTPKQRTVIPTIRNRRFKYIASRPAELGIHAARTAWPSLWPGKERIGQHARQDEKDWADKEFLRGQKQHIGKLGTLLGDYEEEREGERLRAIRRGARAQQVSIPEEDSDSDEDDDNAAPPVHFEETPEDIEKNFERIINERFIYGLLDVSTFILSSKSFLTMSI